MATQTSRTPQGDSAEGSRPAAAVDPQPGMATLVEWPRQQMLVASQALAGMFRSGEAVLRAGLQAGERAALLHGQAAENIRKAGSPAELLSVQATLAVYQAQEALRYWNELSTALLALGSDASAGEAMQSPGLQAAQRTASAASTMVDAAMSAAAPMADALQQMFTAPLKAATGSSRPH